MYTLLDRLLLHHNLSITLRSNNDAFHYLFNFMFISLFEWAIVYNSSCHWPEVVTCCIWTTDSSSPLQTNSAWGSHTWTISPGGWICTFWLLDREESVSGQSWSLDISTDSRSTDSLSYWASWPVSLFLSALENLRLKQQKLQRRVEPPTSSAAVGLPPPWAVCPEEVALLHHQRFSICLVGPESACSGTSGWREFSTVLMSSLVYSV